jgi:hypothetical protein
VGSNTNTLKGETMNTQTKFRTYEFLLATYLFTGSGLTMHGAYTMNGTNILWGLGLFALSLAVFTAMVFEVDNTIERGNT